MLKKTVLSLMGTAILFVGTATSSRAQTPAPPPPPPEQGAPPPGRDAPPPPNQVAPHPRHRDARRDAPPPRPADNARPPRPPRREREAAPPPPPEGFDAYAPESIIGGQARTIEGRVKYVTTGARGAISGVALRQGIFKKDVVVRFTPQLAAQAASIIGVGDRVRVTGVSYKDESGRTYVNATALVNERTGLAANAGTPAPPRVAGLAPARPSHRGAPPPPRRSTPPPPVR